jgi:hypothetical protein
MVPSLDRVRGATIIVSTRIVPRSAKERFAMAVTAKKVYDGLTEHVSSEGDRERIRRSLYRTDASAMGSIIRLGGTPGLRPRSTSTTRRGIWRWTAC